MFNEIGEKIKMLAKVACYIGIGSACIFGFFVLMLMMNAGIGGGAVIGVLLFVGIISFFAWVGSVVLYGFGEMVDDTYKTRTGIEKLNGKLSLLQGEGMQQAPRSSQVTILSEAEEFIHKQEDIVKTNAPIDTASQQIKKDLKNQCEKPEAHPKKEAEKETKPIICPECGGDLTFMGFSERDLMQEVECPFCSKCVKIKES